MLPRYLSSSCTTVRTPFHRQQPWQVAYYLLNAVANTPAEVTHLLQEIHAKDEQIHTLREYIAKSEAHLQRWVRANGGHVRNPKEDTLSRTINDYYDKCQVLQTEKCSLSEKALVVLERQIKRLDVGLRNLSSREEFPGDWGGPSMLSASGDATGASTPTALNGSASLHQPLQAVSGNATGSGGISNIANTAQMRMVAQAAANRSAAAMSGAQSPTHIPRNQREGSSESTKRRRLHVSVGSIPAASSNLRQSPLGPGSPKAATPGPTSSRAGSAQPKPAQKKPAPTRKPAPAPRKRDRDRDRNKKRSADRKKQLTSSRATPSTNASVSSVSPTTSHSPSSVSNLADGADDDDNTLYCFCQRNSRVDDMVGCDNDNCEFQWFHYSCVGIKTQPVGEWLCPSCKKLPRNQIVKGGQDA